MQYGWIKELRKNKLVVIPETGNEVLLSNSQIEYSWKGKSVQSAEEAIQHIKYKEPQRHFPAHLLYPMFSLSHYSLLKTQKSFCLWIQPHCLTI